MKNLLSVLALGLTASVAALPTNNYVVHGRRPTFKRSRSNSELDIRGEKIPMSIAVKQRNLEFAHGYLMEISDPTSSKYGQHWSSERVIKTFAADPESIDAVISWLGSSGISSDRVSVGKGQHWVHFDATVDEAESLLRTEYKVFDSPSGNPILGVDSYSIPAYLQSHIDLITPTVHDGPSAIGLKRRNVEKPKTPKTKRTVGPRPEESKITAKTATFTNSSGPSLDACTDFVTIDCIKYLYNMPTGNLSLSSFGILELYSTFNQSDLDGFYAQEHLDLAAGTGPDIISLDNGEVGTLSGDNGEATLDLEIAIPLVYPQPVQIYQLGTAEQQGTFGNFLDAVDSDICEIDQDSTSIDCGGITSADVVSISWGGDESGSDASYNTRQCNEFLKLGLQGVTVVVSSGDSGVSDGSDCTRFIPTYPASCPYVTSVGATTLTSFTPPTLPEIAVNGFGSGGGFSDIFAIPDYQKSAVSDYLTNYPPPYNGSRFNNTGAARGYPDVSANGQWLGWLFKGAFGEQGGTSMSAPLFGSVITLINNERIAAGKSRVGFINQVLYANPDAFNDIVDGFNNVDRSGCGTKGFEARSGWDPVTGLGTPDYEKLLAVFMALD